ncbi:hypothetical protein [Sutcliffiella horikoshii]|uniref:hypothetical protein n=1 Tax=Sutcliffiella horikoshii TaxID=79883 RepID=UPI001CC05900|nr:hypothetical protein [Sutcliffiella horikoshii]UAL46605.1 hypothetical protein K7887_17100 [Sutcliffiella horikoshii]
MNTHPYTLSKLNEQKLASLQNDNQFSIASNGRRKSIISKLQKLYAKVSSHNQNHQQDPCCPQN